MTKNIFNQNNYNKVIYLKWL